MGINEEIHTYVRLSSLSQLLHDSPQATERKGDRGKMSDKCITDMANPAV